MFYYAGISQSPPKLLYRTGATPWVKPTGPEAYTRLKQARGVFGHKLNVVWDDVGPKVRDLLSTQDVAWTSIDVVRFVRDGDENPHKKINGPVVIWVGVFPNSLKGEEAFTSGKNILDLLVINDIDDVEVEYRESVYTPSVGPELLSPVFDFDNTVSVRGPLTTSLGLQIASSDRQNAEGTMGLYLDEESSSDSKILGLTCRHVLFEADENANDDYVFAGSDAPRKNVQLLGTRAFSELLDSIKAHISSHGIEIRNYERWISELQVELEAGKKGVGQEIGILLEKASTARQIIFDLEEFYSEVAKEWGPPEQRIIGHIRCSPRITFNASSEGYPEDWAVFELDNSKIKAQFQGNVMDLGTEISLGDFIHKMHPRRDGHPNFKYPYDRLLPLHGTITEEVMRDPNMLDHDNKICLFVIKSAGTTGVTIGRATGPFSFVRHDLSSQGSKMWAIYNYDNKDKIFSACGDSGSVIADGLGRIFGLLTGGAGKTETPDVTYATPMWWLLPRIQKYFPNAHLSPAAAKN